MQGWYFFTADLPSTNLVLVLGGGGGGNFVLIINPFGITTTHQKPKSSPFRPLAPSATKLTASFVGFKAKRLAKWWKANIPAQKGQPNLDDFRTKYLYAYCCRWGILGLYLSLWERKDALKIGATESERALEPQSPLMPVTECWSSSNSSNSIRCFSIGGGGMVSSSRACFFFFFPVCRGGKTTGDETKDLKNPGWVFERTRCLG